MTSTRVSGHTLASEGRPYISAWDRRNQKPLPTYEHAHQDTDGYGLCSCGATSAWLSSTSQRRQWHRAHKTAVLKSQESA